MLSWSLTQGPCCYISRREGRAPTGRAAAGRPRRAWGSAERGSLALGRMESAPSDAAAWLARDAVDSLPKGALEARLKEAGEAGRPLRVKLGIDPTTPDIHYGHTVVLRKLREFQELGHTVVLIVGDYTGRVGDPSGRSSERPHVEPDQIDRNAETYQEQAFRVLDP